MKYIYSSAFLFALIAPALAAPVPEVSAGGAIVAATVSIGVMAWIIERRKRG